MKQFFFIGGIIILTGSCKSTKVSVQEDIGYPLKNDSINLYAFIGEKIVITGFDPNKDNEEKVIDAATGDTIVIVNYSMDRGFIAKYKVLKNVFNELPADTVDFVVYDHYGRPAFEDYKKVILYISLNKENGKYYHQKYQFDPVKEINGNWEGTNGKSIKELFENKQKTVFKARGIF